jgi:hypothetical protein
MVDYILHITFAKFKSREGLPGNPQNDNPNEIILDIHSFIFWRHTHGMWDEFSVNQAMENNSGE